jgi:hypothetical protein
MGVLQDLLLVAGLFYIVFFYEHYRYCQFLKDSGSAYDNYKATKAGGMRNGSCILS